MDKEIIKKIYNDIFLYIQHSNIDLFLCGGASNKSYVSNRDQLRKRLEKDKKLSIFYPEDMFMELLSRKKYTFPVIVYIKPFLHIVSRNQSKFSNFLSKLREISQLQIQIFLMKKSMTYLH